MAKKMVKLPKGTTLYVGRGKYVGEAPEALVDAHNKAVAAKSPAKKAKK